MPHETISVLNQRKATDDVFYREERGVGRGSTGQKVVVMFQAIQRLSDGHVAVAQ